jgi:hypothetical protein
MQSEAQQRINDAQKTVSSSSVAPLAPHPPPTDISEEKLRKIKEWKKMVEDELRDETAKDELRAARRAAKRQVPLTIDEDYSVELPALKPPAPPPMERVKEYYMEWTLYAHDVLRAADTGRVYFYEVLVPHRERVAAGISEPESDYAMERRAMKHAEWITPEDGWEPAVLCGACDASDGEWRRLRGTCITACKRCVDRLRDDDRPIVIAAQTARGGVKKAPVFPPVRKH